MSIEATRMSYCALGDVLTSIGCGGAICMDCNALALVVEALSVALDNLVAQQHTRRMPLWVEAAQ